MTLTQQLAELDRTMTAGPWSFDGDWYRLPTLFAGDGRTKIAILEKTGDGRNRDGHTPDQAANAEGIAKLRNLIPEIRAALSAGECAALEVNRAFLREIVQQTYLRYTEPPNDRIPNEACDEVIGWAREEIEAVAPPLQKAPSKTWPLVQVLEDELLIEWIDKDTGKHLVLSVDAEASVCTFKVGDRFEPATGKTWQELYPQVRDYLAQPLRGVETLAAGCCSASSPCNHQKSDPSTICATCEAAAQPNTRDGE